jgi:hypothetical protein
MLEVVKTSTDPVNNLQCLLRLPIFDMTRLVTFHFKCNIKTTLTGFYQIEKARVLMTLIHCMPLTMITVAKCLLLMTMLGIDILMSLSESTSLL